MRLQFTSPCSFSSCTSRGFLFFTRSGFLLFLFLLPFHGLLPLRFGGRRLTPFLLLLTESVITDGRRRLLGGRVKFPAGPLPVAPVPLPVLVVLPPPTVPFTIRVNEGGPFWICCCKHHARSLASLVENHLMNVFERT